MTDVLTRPAPPAPRPPEPGGRRGWVAAAVALVCAALLLGGLLLLPGGQGSPAGWSPVGQPPVGQAPVGEAPDDGVGDTRNLQPALLRAVDKAIAAAAADGVELRVTSGWRSAEHQQELFDAAVQKYGSAARARQWVLPPAESEHVKGGAVDVGPTSGAAWLDAHGEQFGLCRRYDNEPWHFERLAGAIGSSCPARESHA